MPFALNANDKLRIQAADVGQVQAKLAPLAHRHTWLSPGNSIQNGNPPKEKAAFDALSPSDVIELIASRGPLHVADGWGYLSRAISALLAGDTHAARHLAYYAELRAALSILANDGIGIFNGQNRVVDAAGSLKELQKQGTHVMCWATLEFWASEPQSIHKLLQATQINGARLIDAIQVFFPGMSAGALGGSLIREWGFDLQVGHLDRDDRNLSSYNPNSLVSLTTLPADDLAFVGALWGAFEPNAWTLERHLLRKLLENLQGVVGGDPLADRTTEYQYLDARMKPFVSMDFLARNEEPTDHPLIEAAKDSSNPAPAHSMLARGALLLALGGWMSERNLHDAMVQPFAHLQSWWSSFGSERGIWAPGGEPSSMADLWSDVAEALEDLAVGPYPTRHDLLSNGGGAAWRLCEAERIGLWNLCR